MTRSNMIALLTTAARDNIFESFQKYRDTWLLDNYLSEGFIGYDKMTDEELREEMDDLVSGTYSAWDAEEGRLISYNYENGEWINTLGEAA